MQRQASSSALVDTRTIVSPSSVRQIENIRKNMKQGLEWLVAWMTTFLLCFYWCGFYVVFLAQLHGGDFCVWDRVPPFKHYVTGEKHQQKPLGQLPKNVEIISIRFHHPQSQSYKGPSSSTTSSFWGAWKLGGCSAPHDQNRWEEVSLIWYLMILKDALPQHIFEEKNIHLGEAKFSRGALKRSSISSVSFLVLPGWPNCFRWGPSWFEVCTIVIQNDSNLSLPSPWMDLLSKTCIAHHGAIGHVWETLVNQ